MLKDRNGRVALCNLSEVITQVFEQSRLLIHPTSASSLFLYAESPEDAIALLNSAGEDIPL